MKRRDAHFLFTLTALGLVGVLAWQGLALRHHQQLADAIGSIPDSLTSLDELDITDDFHDHPFVQLAIGSALAKGNNLAEAERLQNTLIREGGTSQTGINAQFNLANAYLREALKMGTQTSSKSLPLIELAKQRYRDLLAQAPAHWHARYNLEQALRMAPEGSDANENERVEPVKSVNVIVPGFEKKELP